MTWQDLNHLLQNVYYILNVYFFFPFFFFFGQVLSVYQSKTEGKN